jgi:hypothetical protein
MSGSGGLGAACLKEAPHIEQKILFSSFSVPQLGHFINTRLLCIKPSTAAFPSPF